MDKPTRSGPVTAICFAFYLALCISNAVAQCPPQPDIVSGNHSSDAFFRQHVVKPSEVGKAAASRPSDFVEAEKFGARGNGTTDDTAALQKALNEAHKVWLASGHIYRITQRVNISSNSELASDGTATLLMASGQDAFNNALGRRSENAILGERGTGIRLQGDKIAIRDIFIVKEFEDDRYVIGIDVRASSQVKLQRLRMRGFSLAPGIIVIRSSDNVEVSSTLIHDACTASTKVPEDIPAFQITGISVDDARVNNRGSTQLRFSNNVISDLQMIPLTYRKTQTDGINFNGIGTGNGSVIRDNYIANVDEGLDLFGADIDVSGNRLQATGRVLKFIHGARSIRVHDNIITATDATLAVAIYRANPPEERRQVRDIALERNVFHIPNVVRPAIEVDRKGEFLPSGIIVRDNIFDVSKCNQRILACLDGQCAVSSNQLRIPGNGACRSN